MVDCLLCTNTIYFEPPLKIHWRVTLQDQQTQRIYYQLKNQRSQRYFRYCWITNTSSTCQFKHSNVTKNHITGCLASKRFWSIVIKLLTPFTSKIINIIPTKRRLSVESHYANGCESIFIVPNDWIQWIRTARLKILYLLKINK